MKTLIVRSVSGLICILAVTACSALATPAPAATPTPEVPAGKIVIADIGDDPAKKIEKYQPLADYLAANLGQFGIGIGEVKIAPDFQTMISWIKDGEVDIYFDSPYPSMIINRETGAQLILRRWKKGVEEYNSIIFARADSGITSLADLSGKKVGLEEVYSTTGYFLPMTYMAQADLNLVEKDSNDAVVASDETGYIFTGDDENTAQWVVSGLVDAGAVDSSSYADMPEETRTQLVILTETELVPRNFVITRSDLDPELVAAISSLLINLENAPGGGEILESFDDTTRFDEFSSSETLARMNQLFELLPAR